VELGHRGPWRHPEEIPRKRSKIQDWLYPYIFIYLLHFVGLKYGMSTATQSNAKLMLRECLKIKFVS
jgi:hypothetical protein